MKNSKDDEDCKILPKNETVKWNKVDAQKIASNGTHEIAHKVEINQHMESYMSRLKDYKKKQSKFHLPAPQPEPKPAPPPPDVNIKLQEMIDHLMKHVDDQHKESTDKMMKAIHDKEFIHPLPIIPVVHKVEIPKAKHDDNISVSFKKEPLPASLDIPDNVKIDFGKRPSYKPIINDLESSLDDIPLPLPAPTPYVAPSPPPPPPAPTPPPQQPQVVVVYKNAP